MMKPRHTLLLLVLLIALLPACERGDEADDAAADDPFGVPVDRTVTQYNLEDEVDVLVDQFGIPHIYARNDHDALYVQGYMAALDRFFQMDMARRLGTGRIGELLGEIPLLGPIVATLIIKDIDLYYRTIFIGANGRPIADALLAELDPATEQMLQAYADGINAYIYDMITRRHGVTEPPVYEGIVNPDGAQLDPWTVRDTLALLVVSMWSASNSVDDELAMADALAGLGIERFTDFFRFAPDDPTTVLPDGVSDITPASLDAWLTETPDYLTGGVEAIRAARKVIRAAGNSFFQQGMHSNNWAVDAAHSADGHAMIANDPHLGLLNPPYFWLCHVDSKTLGDGTLSFAGLSFPGAPGVQIGHNDHIGWAGTAANYDTYDAYLETLDPDDSDAVIYNGNSVKMQRAITSEETFALSLDGTHEDKHYPIRIVPHHGPIVPDSCRRGSCVSLRWTGMDAGTEIKAFLDILTATDLDEGLAAFAQYRRGPYNWVVADSDGRVGYIAAAELPIRQNWKTRPPFLPLPGEGGAEWVGTVPDTQIARYLNPSDGFIVTANNDIYGTLRDNDPTNGNTYYYSYVDIGYRAGRIVDLLSGMDGADPQALTLEDMRRIQADNYSVAGSRLVPHLLEAAEARPDLLDATLRGALDFLAAWDYTTPSGVADYFRPAVPDEQETLNSIGATLFHVWFGFAATRTYGDDFDDARLELPGNETESGPQFETRALLRLLEHEDATLYGDRWWDDSETIVVETKEEILLGALRDAIDYLSLEIAPDMTQWQWGKLHTAEYGLTFEGFTIPDLLSPIIGPAAADGGNFTINVANSFGLTEEWQSSHAPAARMVMSIDGERFESWAIMPGGQSERFDSSHYADQFKHYLAGELAPLPYLIDEITPVTVERIKFAPRR